MTHALCINSWCPSLCPCILKIQYWPAHHYISKFGVVIGPIGTLGLSEAMLDKHIPEGLPETCRRIINGLKALRMGM